jgi:hypothetical protein
MHILEACWVFNNIPEVILSDKRRDSLGKVVKIYVDITNNVYGFAFSQTLINSQPNSEVKVSFLTPGGLYTNMTNIFSFLSLISTTIDSTPEFASHLMSLLSLCGIVDFTCLVGQLQL